MTNIWEFPKIRGTLFGVLIIRILLFRVLPIVGNSHLSKANPGPRRRVLESPGTVAGHATSQTPREDPKSRSLNGG